MAMQFPGPLHRPYFQHQHKGEATQHLFSSHA
jgi:hypothetical protein